MYESSTRTAAGRPLRYTLLLAALMAAAFGLLLPGCGDSSGVGGGRLTPGADSPIKVLSNRADLISGGDALVEVLLPAGTAASSVVMTLNGQDVSRQFALRENGRYMAQLSGLVLGENRLAARIGNGPTNTVAIVNHPNGGPVFAGPQPQPYSCSNADKAINAQCDQPAEYSLLYKSIDPTKSGLQPYDMAIRRRTSPAPRPRAGRPCPSSCGRSMAFRIATST